MATMKYTPQEPARARVTLSQDELALFSNLLRRTSIRLNDSAAVKGLGSPAANKDQARAVEMVSLADRMGKEWMEDQERRVQALRFAA